MFLLAQRWINLYEMSPSMVWKARRRFWDPERDVSIFDGHGGPCHTCTQWGLVREGTCWAMRKSLKEIRICTDG